MLMNADWMFPFAHSLSLHSKAPARTQLIMDDTVVGVKFWPYGRLGKVFRGNNKQTSEQLRKEGEKNSEVHKLTDCRTSPAQCDTKCDSLEASRCHFTSPPKTP